MPASAETSEARVAPPVLFGNWPLPTIFSVEPFSLGNSDIASFRSFEQWVDAPVRATRRAGGTLYEDRSDLYMIPGLSH